jgi:hypothetical protein
MKKTIILLLLTIIQLSYSQEQKNSFATFSITKPFLTFAPRIAVGYVHQINEKYWLGVEAGYGTDATRLDERTKNGYKGFEIRPELYYDTKASERIKHFVSFSVFYIQKKQTKSFEKYTTDDQDYSFDSADYLRNKKGFSVSYAPLIPFGKSKSFGFMPKFGIGLSHSTVKYENVTNREEAPSREGDFLSFGYFGSTEKSRVNFDVNIDLKLVYRF